MSATNGQQHLGPVTRHEQLWFEDGTLVLQAEQTIFKVHQSILGRHSEFFKDMLSLSQGAQPQREEGTENCPLLVPDVSAGGLSTLFTMLYQVWGAPQMELKDEELISVLRTAHRLQFAAILKAVVSTLSSRLGAAQKLNIGMECHIDEWQQPAFEELVLGFQDVPFEHQLGENTCNKVYRARARVVDARGAFILSRSTRNACCTHKVSALLFAIPSTPRSQLLEQCTKYHAQFQDSSCCPTVEGVATIILPEEKEREIAGAVWKGKTTHQVKEGFRRSRFSRPDHY